MPEQPIALFDMDGTLCDYDLGLESSLAPLRCPHEPRRRVRDRESKWLKARMDLIRSSTDWWADLPRLDLGFDLWRMAGEVGYRRMILTQGPKKNPNASLISLLTPKTLTKQMNILGESTATDVTKGMLGKIKESSVLVSHGGEVVILNLKRPQNLSKFLRGEDVPCTRFISDSRKR